MMTTKTKNKTVIKAHRGMAHVPRGRRRPLNPRQRPQVEPRRRGDDRPRAPGIDRPQMPRGRNPRLPANFFQMSPNARKQFLAVRAAKDARGRQITPAQRDRMTPAQRDRMIRQMELARRRFNQQRRRKRPTGTPIPQQKRDKSSPFTQQVRQAQPVGIPQEVRQARQEPRVAQPVPIPATMAAKGKFITKKNIGANDYRQGGMVLNSIDNRKNKK